MAEPHAPRRSAATRAADAARDYYASRVAAYRHSSDHGRASDLTRMLAWLEVRPAERALDVATGGGHSAVALSQAGARVVATDLTRGMLAAMTDGPALWATSVAAAARLPFASASFDIVTCRIAAHHFSALPAFVAEAARVLRPGGRLYAFDLTTPEDASQARAIDAIERRRDPSHVASWPPSAWRAALAAAGLSIAREEVGASRLDLEAWLARATLDEPTRDQVVAMLRASPAAARGGYGLDETTGGGLQVLRYEVLARQPA